MSFEDILYEVKDGVATTEEIDESIREEIASALTHGLGAVFALAGSAVLITLAAIDADHLHMLLDGGNGGHEAFAVEAVGIQLPRRLVGGGDDHHAAVEQHLEQAACCFAQFALWALQEHQVAC